MIKILKTKKIAEYDNGNVHTILYSDGTRVRTTEDNEFRPEFAENIDIHISSKCNNGCDMCYANCTPDGEFGNILNNSWVYSLHEGTEVAVNLNFPIHPDFFRFATILRDNGVILNVTISRRHFDLRGEFIDELYDQGLIKGLGISVTHDITPGLIKRIQRYDNVVVHVINGLFDERLFNLLKDKGLKLLILGYKQNGRGLDYLRDCGGQLRYNTEWLENNLKSVFEGFDVVCFDNLALEQLSIKDKLSDEAWEETYCGADGDFSFYIDTVKGEFAKSSIDRETYNIHGDVDKMFQRLNRGEDYDKADK